MLRQAFFLLILSVSIGVVRQWAPNGISGFGRWPTKNTEAREAYKMMAVKGDPPFISLPDVIEVRDQGGIILDARSHSLYVEGHVPGARSLPFYELDKYMDTALGDLAADTPIMIYCEGVVCELSFYLGRELQAAGYTNIHIFYGGYPEWTAAGLPVEK
jgi:rhodanese-related sulfurtransferase